MKRPVVLVVLALGMFTSSVAAQTPTAAQAPTQMVRAAGMSLPDGALPPGSLTVRIVQGAFVGDLTGIPVHLEVGGGEPRQELTGTQGRAEFAHLPVGARVRAFATVDGERLESEAFAMPATSGVRVLLVVGADAGASTGPVGLPPMAPAMAPPIAPVTSQSTSMVDPGANIVRFALGGVTVGLMLFFVATAYRRRRV